MSAMADEILAQGLGPRGRFALVHCAGIVCQLVLYVWWAIKKSKVFATEGGSFLAFTYQDYNHLTPAALLIMFGLYELTAHGESQQNLLRKQGAGCVGAGIAYLVWSGLFAGFQPHEMAPTAMCGLLMPATGLMMRVAARRPGVSAEMLQALLLDVGLALFHANATAEGDSTLAARQLHDTIHYAVAGAHANRGRGVCVFVRACAPPRCVCVVVGGGG